MLLNSINQELLALMHLNYIKTDWCFFNMCSFPNGFERFLIEQCISEGLKPPVMLVVTTALAM